MTAIIAFFVSPIGRILAIGIAAVAIVTGAYVKGDLHGRSVVQAKWDAAEQAAVARGEKARTDAERTIDARPATPGVPDEFNRD